MRTSEPISKRLKRFREERHLTMREAAKLIGVPETTYREWEYGRAIRGEPYLKIARAFGISLDDLLGDNKSHHHHVDKDFDRIIEELEKLKLKVRK